eukprot:250502-Chlamydomonas_euryale.AAC.17
MPTGLWRPGRSHNSHAVIISCAAFRIAAHADSPLDVFEIDVFERGRNRCPSIRTRHTSPGVHGMCGCTLAVCATSDRPGRQPNGQAWHSKRQLK